ncbi:ferredoxin Fer [Halegenticoccus tardaugens]|uniref:ferredoxin Fer n=1 Tax=Halegenticoccus tardaugens TaxID=2071624 RepID=UPI00100B321B|nr:ferredoxin Fer [Halegenticoccus tardaugens]
MDSPFDILGIDEDAVDEEVDQAYRRRVKEAHPDHGGSLQEFQLVRAAYDEIRNGYRPEGRDVGPESVENPDDEVVSRVEYLNYEVLDDHGWDLDDENLFEKASAAGLDPADRGRMSVQPHESLLEAAENRGFAWPYACRGGACANCAIAVVDGGLDMPGDHILPSDMTDRGIQLSCVSTPTTEEMKIVYNVKHLPHLDELRLPADRFERAYPTD